MKHILIITVLICCTQNVLAQVGIGNTNPQAQLEITASNQTAPAITDGVLIPKIDNFPAVNPTIAQDGMLVYVTGSGTPTKGFYYWDNASTNWKSLTAKLLLEDADGDTKIQVEESADEDIIRFGTAGTEFFRMNNGRLEVVNTGNSVFIGQGAGANDDLTNNQNTFLGFNAGLNNTIGDRNVAIGEFALAQNVSGIINVAIGHNALDNNIDGDSNIAVGSNSLNDLTSGVQNIAIGSDALGSNILGFQNVSIGHQSGQNGTTGSRNVFLGSFSGRYATGNNNVFLGRNAGSGNTVTGSGNVFLGFAAGQDESGSNKLYIENSSSTTPLVYGEFDNDLLRVNGTLNINNAYSLPTVDGSNNQMLATDGSGNITWSSIDKTLLEDTDADTKIQVEESADEDIIRFDMAGTEYFRMNNGKLEVVNTGRSVFIGEGAGESDDLANNDNIAIGYHALKNNSSATGNVAMGYAALFSKTSGSYNTAIGFRALGNGTTTSNSIGIGNQAGYLNNGNGNVFIGNTAGYSETGSNKLYIENSTTTDPLLYGEFDNNRVGIHTGSPTATLSVNGTANKPGGGTWATFSDRRLKQNITDYTEGLDLIKNIHLVNYQYNNKYTQLFGENTEIQGKIYQGVIAQELQNIAPDMVKEVSVEVKAEVNEVQEIVGTKTYLQVDSSKFTYALINAVKEQQQMIEELLEQQQKMQEEIDKLKQKIKE